MVNGVGPLIAAIIKNERKKQGLSRAELAKRAGCSERIIQYWEEGIRVPSSISLISKVLEVLGVSYTIGK